MVVDGVTTISFAVDPVDQSTLEVHPFTVSVTGSTPQVTLLDAVIEGVGKAETLIVRRFDVALTQEPAEQVAE